MDSRGGRGGTMMLQANSPFSRHDASSSSSRAHHHPNSHRHQQQQQQQQQALHLDLAQQLRDSMEECTRLRQALETLNDSSLNYKNNSERAMELAKKEISSLKNQVKTRGKSVVVVGCSCQCAPLCGARCL